MGNMGASRREFSFSHRPMDTEIPKAYDPKQWESDLYHSWEESGFFNPDNLPGERTEAFSIIMPPPNANGRLHAGHALFVTIEDVFTRFNRMNGKKALWVPGADHAGFETQVVYERKLEKEGRSRFDLTRDELYQEIYDFTIENKGHMERDLRKLGASCDWSRNAFTLDPKIVVVVQETFRKMFRDGLVYRGKRIVNWCSKHQTGLSDVETENQESVSKLYYFKYGPFDIATVRPETKFGDKFVVIHPDDDRYKQYRHGDKLTVEWINGPIEATIIKDPVMDVTFGTGVMTITPWHSQVDYELALKYGLDYEQIIDEQGSLLPIAGEFAGMNIDEAREKIVEKLEKKGLLVKVDEDYQNVKKVCYKCETVIEPQARDQWFVKMKPLAELALKAVRDNKEIQFHPKNYEKIFTYWMENTIDWNISRQIVWGIPIPAQYCTSCNAGYIEKSEGDSCVCGGTIVSETDTFDTWFSSGQWPLLALGYPELPDVATYHPTTVMETGHDLIFKWIPRMVIFSLYLKQEIPFHHVYLHGLVNDEHGKKMSKSKGNVISPNDLSDEYGTDALRMALITGNAPGNDIPLSPKKVEAYRNFANKLWNLARYVANQPTTDNRPARNASRIDAGGQPTTVPKTISDADKDLTQKLERIVASVTRHLDRYELSLAAEELRAFTWDDFADWYVEVHKIEKNDALLRYAFDIILKLWHPFMPFVTEAIHQTLHLDGSEFLMVAPWPAHSASRNVAGRPVSESTHKTIADENRFELVKSLIVRIRAVRAVYRIDPALKMIVSADGTSEELIRDNEEIFKRLARVSEVRNLGIETPKNSIPVQAGPLRAFLHLDGAVDIAAEKARLGKELAETERYAKSVETKLSNPNFADRAPKDVIDVERAKLDDANKKIEEFKTWLATLG
jgi:valyl-tRNA synthetase